MTYRVSRERFEELAEQALKSLPEGYLQYFHNITIIVEDMPSQEELRALGKRDGLLLGLFSGIPHTAKGGFFDLPQALPDMITLYQRNLEKISSSEKELVNEIRQTLIHEVGHYFGLSEDDLRKYE